MIEIFIDFEHRGKEIRDQILWDLTNPDNSPEELSLQLA